MRREMKQIMVRLPVELHEALRRAAAESGRSVNSEIWKRLQVTIDEGWQIEEEITVKIRSVKGGKNIQAAA